MSEKKKKYEWDSEKTLGLRDELDAFNKNNAAPVFDPQGTHQGAVNEALKKIQERKPFTYDLNGDMLYKQYADRATQQGRMAMQGAMGQAAAMTGGFGNSYAATVGNQAFQDAMLGLNDKIPGLYELAMRKYDNETADMLNELSIAQGNFQTAYGMHRDDVADYNAERTRRENALAASEADDYAKMVDVKNEALARAELGARYGDYSGLSGFGIDTTNAGAGAQEDLSTSEFMNLSEKITEAYYAGGEDESIIREILNNSTLSDADVERFVNYFIRMGILKELAPVPDTDYKMTLRDPIKYTR
jgi:hypothetical protein